METAVEWLVGQLKKIEYNPLEKNGYSNAKERLYEQAKQMEKQQIINAYKEGMGNVDGCIVDKNGVEEYYD